MNIAPVLKAEAILAIQLVTRHRSPRLVLLFAASLVLVVLSNDAGTTPAAAQRSVLLVAGTLGAVAGSRLLARGGALWAARCAAASSLVPPVGRLLGLTVLVGPVLLLVCLAIPGGDTRLAAPLLVALLFAAVAGVLTMALTPAVGASAAAALGFFAALLGDVRPSQVGALLASWPVIRTPAVLLWNALPLPWRASRWLLDGPARGDGWLFAAWLVAGLWAAAWAIERFPETGGRGESP